MKSTPHAFYCRINNKRQLEPAIFGASEFSDMLRELFISDIWTFYFRDLNSSQLNRQRYEIFIHNFIIGTKL